MSTKMLSVLSYLLIAGLLIFLVLMFFEPKSAGADPSTRGLGSTMTLLTVVALVCLVLFNMPSNSGLKYLGLVVGLICVAVLIVFLLGLSGSSLVFQDTRQPFKPEYDDPVLMELFTAFHKGKVSKWESLLQAHPEHVHHKKLLEDVLYDANADSKSNAHKLKALQYMLDAGAKLDSSLCHDFAQFAYTGQLDFAELLLQHGADPNCDINPSRPLFYIMQGYPNSIKSVELLVKYGADPNIVEYNEQFKESLTPLLMAAYLGYWHYGKVLLENGADLYYKNKDGLTIKAYLLKTAENPEDLGYYKTPEFLDLIEEVKRR